MLLYNYIISSLCQSVIKLLEQLYAEMSYQIQSNFLRPSLYPPAKKPFCKSNHETDHERGLHDLWIFYLKITYSQQQILTDVKG